MLDVTIFTSQHFFVQSQQWKHQNDILRHWSRSSVSNLFKITLNRWLWTDFTQFFWCSHCRSWTSKNRLGYSCQFFSHEKHILMFIRGKRESHHIKLWYSIVPRFSTFSFLTQPFWKVKCNTNMIKYLLIDVSFFQKLFLSAAVLEDGSCKVHPFVFLLCTEMIYYLYHSVT